MKSRDLVSLFFRSCFFLFICRFRFGVCWSRSVCAVCLSLITVTLWRPVTVVVISVLWCVIVRVRCAVVA